MTSTPEAFRLEAMDYLLKPVERGRLAETIDRAAAPSRKTLPEPPVVSAKAVAPPTTRTKLLVRANTGIFIVDANDDLRHHR